VLVAAAVIVAGASINAVAVRASAAHGPTSAALPTLEAKIAAAVNAVRAEHGLSQLRPSQPLGSAAAFHSFDMVRHGFFSHNSSNGSSSMARLARFYPPAGHARWWVGETLCWHSGWLNADTVVRDWLASPEHRTILLAGQFRELGITAVHTSAFDGYAATLVTADFGARAG
jgi:uncharacterized protein YkwD